MIEKKKYRTTTQIRRIKFFRTLIERSKAKTNLFSNISPESGYFATMSMSAGISRVRFNHSVKVT